MSEPTSLEDIAALARHHAALNLAQGYPETSGPREVRAAAAAALMDGSNQYAPVKGQLDLREAVADFYCRNQRLRLTADQVLITSGGTEALASTILALVRPGDDIVVIEPMYDAYGPLIRQAGGNVIPFRLEPPLWQLDATRLASAITTKTKFLLMSNPANPMSRVFDEAELRELSHLCVERDLVVISDEVWEHIVYDGRTHHSLASFPGMWPRTIKIGSAGKLLSLTGWKVGFVCADAHFLDQIQRKHQFLTFSTPPHLQTAVGFGLRREAGEFDRERSELAASRDFLTNRLQEHGFDVLASESTYFLYIDLAASGVTLTDAEFCRLAIVEAQVVTIPLSVLYAAAPPIHLLRACFARPDEMLVEGAARLAKAREFCLGA